ncbi:hypothetical protein T440DRAFT_54921 [Plenodomus tracheiphilus IPT5]|uniref:Heterokaryon incompatibility domain-containing protein n=1 Tax=Plenodomus tracheiphilus IPT5 TaxID=1408161 RepID=A0A6A7B8G4_9PLEO|nr:hypothetical protein T440DRAFT_54921 [Plenodomus tracheiphilus IPT5]
MKDIYSRAHVVVSWLDKTSYDAASAFQRGGTQPVLRAAVAEILSNVYFTRLWVVHEFLLAKSLLMFCGDIWIDREKINQILKRDIYRADHTSRTEGLFWRSSYRPRAQVDVYLCTSLLYWASMNCEDSRDKVYGFLGLVLDEFPDIDYDKPVQEVYLDAVRCVLVNERYVTLSSYNLRALSGLATQMHMADIGSPTLVLFLEIIRRVVNAEPAARGWQGPETGFALTQGEKQNRWWCDFDGQKYSYEW